MAREKTFLGGFAAGARTQHAITISIQWPYSIDESLGTISSKLFTGMEAMTEMSSSLVSLIPWVE